MSDDGGKDDLETYLQDHYAGAISAIELLEHLEKAHSGDSLGAFFETLRAEVRKDHEQLHNLMTALSFEPSGVRNAGAWMVEKFSRVKLGFSAGEDGGLRLLQSLETLFLGITGKKMLWRALREVRESSPVLAQTDFDLLEERADEQLKQVEAERLIAVRTALIGR